MWFSLPSRYSLNTLSLFGGYSFPSTSQKHTWEYNTKAVTTFLSFFPEHAYSRVENAMVTTHCVWCVPKRRCVCTHHVVRGSWASPFTLPIYHACPNRANAAWAAGWTLPGNTNLTALGLCTGRFQMSRGPFGYTAFPRLLYGQKSWANVFKSVNFMQTKFLSGGNIWGILKIC